MRELLNSLKPARSLFAASFVDGFGFRFTTSLLGLLLLLDSAYFLFSVFLALSLSGVLLGSVLEALLCNVTPLRSRVVLAAFLNVLLRTSQLFLFYKGLFLQAVVLEIFASALGVLLLNAVRGIVYNRFSSIPASALVFFKLSSFTGHVAGVSLAAFLLYNQIFPLTGLLLTGFVVSALALVPFAFIILRAQEPYTREISVFPSRLLRKTFPLLTLCFFVFGIAFSFAELRDRVALSWFSLHMVVFASLVFVVGKLSATYIISMRPGFVSKVRSFVDTQPFLSFTSLGCVLTLCWVPASLNLFFFLPALFISGFSAVLFYAVLELHVTAGSAPSDSATALGWVFAITTSASALGVLFTGFLLSHLNPVLIAGVFSSMFALFILTKLAFLQVSKFSSSPDKQALSKKDVLSTQ